MNALNITGKQLITIGYPQSPAITEARRIAATFAEAQEAEVLSTLAGILAAPEAYGSDNTWASLAAMLMIPADDTIQLKDNSSFVIYGPEAIEAGARAQMQTAVRLPVSVAGALMPDAHQGYGLPIGGVLATDNAVIPYGVGVDIGCRMALSIFDVPAAVLETQAGFYAKTLLQHSAFGAGNGFSGAKRADHAVLENAAFGMNRLTRSLKDKAWAQLGSSGGGNHFVEWGAITFAHADNEWNIPVGEYLALLTHSGSRGLGATLAGHYTRVAKEICKLPKEAQNLAYLDLDTAAGQEYWLAMHLAGDYASACHEVIHQKMTAAIAAPLLARVENHHNFAWKEMLSGQEVVVHRKGATPAGAGVHGIIPGSMTAPGFLVRGKGEAAAINSASHGAGRQMSRTRAEQAFTPAELKAILQSHGVTLLGGGLDEAPGAYKDIRAVMKAQEALVEIIAEFTPKIVRMADDGSRED